MRWMICVFAVVLVVAGCGSKTVPAAAGPPVWVEPSCPEKQELFPGGSVTRGSIPADFGTAWVLRCRTDVRDLPGKGKWQVQITERADTAAPELMEQLRKPSDERSEGACTLDFVVPPYFVLVDAGGKAILPAVPADGCGKPRQSALRALEALPFRAISETPLNQVQTPESAATGCASSWKDMLTISADSAEPGPAAPLWSRPVSTFRVCVYDRISGGQLPVGQFSSARELTGEPARALLTALNAAGPAAACSAPHTRFAVLTAEGVADWATVELDGCHRLLRPDNTFGQLDAATAAAAG
jgi:hypothetical protein